MLREAEDCSASNGRSSSSCLSICVVLVLGVCCLLMLDCGHESRINHKRNTKLCAREIQKPTKTMA